MALETSPGSGVWIINPIAGDNPVLRVTPAATGAEVRINAAYAYLGSQGGVIELSAGFFGLNDSIQVMNNTVIRGAGMGITIIKQTVIERRAFIRGEILTNVKFKDFTLQGMAQDDTGLGNDDDRGFVINTNSAGTLDEAAYTRLTFESVEVCYIKQMALTCSGWNYVEMIDCYIHHINRDGINTTTSANVKIIGTKFKGIHDDAVAVHINVLQGNPPAEGLIVQGCFFEDCQGIKALGGRKISITGNQFSRCKSYGFFTLREVNEGYPDSYDIKVVGNGFSDTIDGTKFGLESALNEDIFLGTNTTNFSSPPVGAVPIIIKCITKADPAEVTFGPPSGAATVAIQGIAKNALGGVLSYNGTNPINGDMVYIEGVGGMIEVNNSAYLVGNLNTTASPPTFVLLNAATGVPVNTSGFSNYTSSGTFKLMTVPHEMDRVFIQDVVGMTQVNGLAFTVAGQLDNKFNLAGINSTGYTTYASGGTLKRIPVPRLHYNIGNSVSSIHPGGQGVVLANNVHMGSTLPPVPTYSDWGFGECWTSNGPANPDMSTGYTRASNGITITSAWRDVHVNNCHFTSLKKGISLSTLTTYLGHLKINSCIFKSVGESGINLYRDTTYSARIEIDHCHFDGDPDLESTFRTPGGTWTSTTALNGINATDVSGVSVTNCVFRNLPTTIAQVGTVFSRCDNNDYIMQPSISMTMAAANNASNKGIRDPRPLSQYCRVIWENSDPMSPTYGAYLGTQAVIPPSSVPTAGYWIAGQIVWSRDTAQAGSVGVAYNVAGFRRLTTGNANGVGDWYELRAFTGN
jgi:hypothetical protein